MVHFRTTTKTGMVSIQNWGGAFCIACPLTLKAGWLNGGSKRSRSDRARLQAVLVAIPPPPPPKSATGFIINYLEKVHPFFQSIRKNGSTNSGLGKFNSPLVIRKALNVVYNITKPRKPFSLLTSWCPFWMCESLLVSANKLLYMIPFH